MGSHPQPGRLGNPDETLGTDQRTDPRLASVAAVFGIDGHGDPLPVDASTPVDQLVEFCNIAEQGFQELFDYRKLLAAGVPTVGRMVAGTCHAGDLIFEQAMPDVYHASVRDVVGFAASV